jgi:hypothetical protein
LLIVGGLVLAALVVVIAYVVQQALEEPGDLPASGGLALLARAPQPADQLPQNLLVGRFAQQLRPESFRLVAEVEGVRHYAGLTRAGEICLVTYLEQNPPSWTSGTSCVRRSDFENGRLSHEVQGPAQKVKAILIPDGFDTPATRAVLARAGAGLEQPNLIVFSGQIDPVVITGVDGRTLQLP